MHFLRRNKNCKLKIKIALFNVLLLRLFNFLERYELLSNLNPIFYKNYRCKVMKLQSKSGYRAHLCILRKGAVKQIEQIKDM